MASYGADHQQHESTSFSHALLLATERLKVIVAVHPGLWQRARCPSGSPPPTTCRTGASPSTSSAAGSRPSSPHWASRARADERYRRTAEFMQVLRRIWTSDEDSSGADYRIHDFDLKPTPLTVPGRAHPEIFQGGNPTAARYNGGRHADRYFSDGKDYGGFTEQVTEVLAHSTEEGGRAGRARACALRRPLTVHT